MTICGTKVLYSIQGLDVYASVFNPGGTIRRAILGEAPSIDYIPIRLPEYGRRYQTVSQMIAELAAMANCVWGVDEDRNFFMRIRGNKDSGILVSDYAPDPGRLELNRVQPVRTAFVPGGNVGNARGLLISPPTITRWSMPMGVCNGAPSPATRTVYGRAGLRPYCPPTTRQAASRTTEPATLRT